MEPKTIENNFFRDPKRNPYELNKSIVKPQLKIDRENTLEDRIIIEAENQDPEKVTSLTKIYCHMVTNEVSS